jgi:hypothetical protein
VRDILEKTLKLQKKWWSEHTHVWWGDALLSR